MQMRIKLIASFLVIALICGYIGYVGFSGVHDVFTIFDGIADDTAPELILLGEIKSLSHELQLEAISYVLLIQSSATDDSIQEELEEFEKTNIELDEIIIKLTEHEEAEEEEELEEMEFLEQVTVLKTRLHVTSLAIMEEADKGASSQIIVTMKEDLEQVEEELLEVIKIRIDLEKEELESRDSIADQLSIDVSNFIIVVSASGVLFAVILGVIISRSISNPLEKLRNVTKEISLGNLDVRIKIKGNDEIAELFSDVNTMQDSLLRQKEELIKNEKINALGNITSSLAHNLKNPLAVIKATTGIIESTLNSVDEKTQERLNLIKVSTENILNQIEDILDFVKQKPLELKETSLSEILNTAINNIEKPERIKINLPENGIKIKCDSAKLQVVFMNLITNSIESIEGDGEITIEGYQNKRETTIEIIDTGSINPVDLEKMFDVLFTTKPTGTGLGLPYCKNVIQQHGGSIEVSMDPTKFTIILPC